MIGAIAQRSEAAPPASRHAFPARLVLLVGPGLRAESPLSRTLGSLGLRCLWQRSVGQALDIARLMHIDAVVLDSSELELSGTGPTLPLLRQRLACPIVVVSQDADEIDEILALELGADAFLVRPLAPRRLRAHLMALMRPAADPGAGGAAPSPAHESRGAGVAPAGPTLAGWVLDGANGSLNGRGRRVELTLVQCTLMQCLMEAAGHVVSPRVLTAALAGGPRLAERSICVYIFRLRKRLMSEGVQELRVDAVRGRGYALRDAVTE